MTWMRLLGSWSIRRKLLLVLLLLFLPAFGIIVASGIRERHEEIRRAQTHALFVVESLAAQQEQIVVATRMLLSTLANSREVQRLDAPACSRLLHEIHERYPFYSIIAAARPDGDVFAASEPFAPGTNLADRKHIRDAIQTRDFSVGEYIKGRTSNVFSINYTFPVLDAHQHLIAILIAGFALKEYSRFLGKVNLAPEDVVILADWKGVRLLRLPETDAVRAGKPLPPDTVARISGRAVQGLYERIGEDGIDRIYAYRQLRLSDAGSSPYLYMIAGMAKGPVLARATRQLWASLAILGIVATLALLLSWWLGNAVVVRPVRRLVAATHRLAQGEFDARTGLPHTPDEVGTLAAAFDQMAALLQTRSQEREQAERALTTAYAELEQRVQERTRALSTANQALTAENAERQRAEASLGKRTAQLEAIREVSADLTRELDLKQVLRLVVQRAITLVGADSGGIFLWSESERALTTERWEGALANWRTVLRFAPGEGVVGTVGLRQEGMRVNDYRCSAHAHPVFVAETNVTAVLAEPLLYRDRLQGVLVLTRAPGQGPFTEDDQALLRLFAAHAASAVENARLFAEAQREIAERTRSEEALRARTDQLETVRAVSAEIARELDLTALLRLIIHRAVELTRTDIGAIFLWDEPSQVLIPQVWTDRSARHEAWIASFRPRLGEGLVGRVAERQIGEFINDYREWPHAIQDYVERANPTALMAEPLVYRNRLMGVISTTSTDPGRVFDDSDQVVLRLLAAQAASAVENARLFAEAQREIAERTRSEEALRARTDQLETIRAVSAEIARELDLGALLKLIIRNALELTQNSSGSIFLWDEPSQTLVPRVWTDRSARHEAWIASFRPRLGEGLVGRVAERQIGEFINNYRQWPQANPDYAEVTRTTALLAEPLVYRNRLVGVIATSSTDPRRFFDESDQAIFRLFAAHAAIAIENAHLYTAIREALATAQRTQAEFLKTEQLRGLGQMAAGIAHDLNNTLATVLGQVELAHLTNPPPALQDILDCIDTAASDGAAVVRRLQEFARPKGTSPLTPCDLTAIVRDAIQVTRPRWQAEPQRRGTTITLDAQLPDLPLIQGYAPELREALTNLIFNAVDAMPEGGTLSIEGHATAETVILSVSDTGVGMPPAVQARIFEPFFTTKGARGTGLGLAVVYGIVTRHGGNVTVSSTPGQGTTFTLTFLRAAAPGPSAAPPPTLAESQSSWRILVVDDEELVRQTTVLLLQAIGHRVTEAPDGMTALTALSTLAVDVVLTDLGMPGMSGWELARHIVRRHPNLPVILLTGWQEKAPGDDEDRRCVAAILGKPVRLEELRRTIQTVMTQRSPSPAPSFDQPYESPG